MGFGAFKKVNPSDPLKPPAENYLTEIIGTNLEYAVDAYEWDVHVPVTDDGKTVSGFWHLGKGDECPEGYEMAIGGRFLTSIQKSL